MRQVKFLVFILLLSLNTSLSFSQLTNDLCSSALEINEVVFQGTSLSGPHSNVGATGNDISIDDVTGCWVDHLTGDVENGTPQIDATVWFQFEGFDGSLSLFVQPCDSNLNFLSQDTQMILYKGECDSLEAVVCNEDFNAAANYYWSGITTEVQAGVHYYLAVDGFNYSGFGSPEIPLTTGEFCLSSQQPEVAVVETSSPKCSAYPNPTEGMVTLNSESPILEVAVFDAYGMRCDCQIVRNNLLNATIELPGSAGMYLVHMKTKSGSAIRRIIRN